YEFGQLPQYPYIGAIHHDQTRQRKSEVNPRDWILSHCVERGELIVDCQIDSVDIYPESPICRNHDRQQVVDDTAGRVDGSPDENSVIGSALIAVLGKLPPILERPDRAGVVEDLPVVWKRRLDERRRQRLLA